MLASAVVDADARRSGGRYELKSEIARGGMGAVYRAYDRLAAREVAYKRLLVPNNRSRAQFVGLFQREYDTLVQLKHPAIVDAYEYGFDDEGAFYTMELLTGQGLMELAPLPAREVCRILRDVASALALLHARRLIHRDLSPGNVRLNGDGRTKLIDFGALAPFGPVPNIVGTPGFMAPETFERGCELDQRADLYALGALAYFTLTRRTAVRAATIADLPTAFLAPIDPPSRHADVPPALDELVMSLLSRNPLARPQTAAEVMERLTTIAELGSEPDEALVAESYMSNPRLVGRAGVLARLELALPSLDKGGKTFMLLAAEGQGRSAVLSHLTVAAQLAGATVLRADAALEAAPFALAQSLVRTALALHPQLHSGRGKDSEFQQLINPRRVAAAGNAPWSAVNASERQARTLALMQDLLLSACDTQPTVIIVDELQRADSESLALLATMASEASNHPLLLVASASKAIAPTDAYLKIKSHGRVLELEPLSPNELQELTANIFGGAVNGQRLARWLHEQTGGNPGSCLNLLRILLERGLIRYTAGTFTLPHDIGPEVTLADPGAALRARLQGIGATAREVALALSLQEVATTLELLASTLALDTRAVVLALEQLSARGIATVNDGLAMLVSASWKEALASSMDEPTRKAMHLRFARAMLAEGSNLSGRAGMQAGVHLLKAGEEQEAVKLLTSGMRHDWIAEAPPVAMLETILDILRKQGRSDEHCLQVLVPLVRGGFYGEMDAQRRHFDRTLRALANVCGVTLMARVRPYLGAKLALIVGLVVAGFRIARTPKDLRFGTLKESLAALLTCAATSIAAFASACEAKRCMEILAVLAPLRAVGPGSVPVVFLDFCQASIDLGRGRFGASRAGFEKLLEQLKRPLDGLDPRDQEALRHGVLHGLAQDMVMEADPQAMRVADELEKAHMFYAPHAQNVKMGYYGYRGEADRCEVHRKRCEVLALRGGISWSSVVVMNLRLAYISMEVGDPVALVRIAAEFERLSGVAPNTLMYRDAVRGCLELLRGRPERAVEIYEQLFSNPNAEGMVVRCLDRTYYAKALSALGRHADAKRACQQALAELDPLDPIYCRKLPMQQLALADAGLGDTEGAARALDAIIEILAPYKNPLWSGGAHRDRAKVALFAQDREAFGKHARAMQEHFESTRNPALIQQCELLQSAAALRATGTKALDDAALAFETDQARLISAETMSGFETEVEPANDRAS